MNENLDYQAYQEHTFAIVDASMLEELPAGLITEALVPKKLAASAHLMPRLIDLRRTPRARAAELFAFLCDESPAARSLRAVVLIRTDADAPATIRHWNSMQLATPQPGRRLWLRLHDPRVLHQLLRILSPDQRRKMFALMQVLTYWIGGAWVSAERDIPDQSDTHAKGRGAASPYAGALMWDWSRIERIGMVNRALHGAGVCAASALDKQGLSAERLIERAIDHGLAEQADLVEFATRGLVSHPGFDTHLDIARAIKPSRDADSGLSDRFALVPEHVWAEVRLSTTPHGER